ncbi:helix-turn-helix domain-containing protein [Microbacterium sp. STN6]|uniref:winged helix-turn-helix transcriptional regulator n=1 Tax=Microbacterium sp. STN6 TaxID=2995588 RepID=UPI002260C964|nr:helix-turn-helix domain-containing protein [Microbacterium sp. STN6]MCX7520683.1 helix-turn-helix domain-containing protein [Microbacterium sp. STN6]
MAEKDASATAALTEPRCSVARSAQLLADRWSVLIVRDAFRGVTRFSDFRSRLGIPSDILTARLNKLVESGVFERRPYRDDGGRERLGYHLTESGRALLPVLGALVQWGDTYRASEYGPSRIYRSATTGERLRVAFVTESGEVIADENVEVVAGPGEIDDVAPYRPGLAPSNP